MWTDDELSILKSLECALTETPYEILSDGTHVSLPYLVPRGGHDRVVDAIRDEVGVEVWLRGDWVRFGIRLDDF